MDELRAISTFIHAAEAGSFQAAATAQGTSPQAVSKTVRQLEHHLGVRLFHRTTRKISLTDDGARLLATAKPNLDGLRGALEEARGANSEVEGLIRISAAGPVGRKVLVPVLIAFQSEYPRVQIDLVLDDGFSDLVAERIDVGFRAGSPPDAQVIVRRLFPIQQIVCAAPSYLKKHPTPLTPEDLTGHRCTGYRQRSSGRPMAWEFCIGGQVQFRNIEPVLTSTDPEAEMRVVLGGEFIGQIDSINSAALIRTGELAPLMLDTLSDRMGLFIYYPQRADMPARIRRFIDFSIERLRDNRDFFLSHEEIASHERRESSGSKRRR
jgi:DNA-binding transcriptional LysR family regulator